jgi:tyrosyl-tRNA synthetase
MEIRSPMNTMTPPLTIPSPATTRIGAPDLAREQGVNPVDYLRQRGFIHDLTDDAGLRAAFDHGPVTCYVGFDPTGPSLHAGHMVSIMLLATLQRMGHRPIALAGGGTALVGDPSGRTSTREIIRPAEIDANLTAISGQLASFLDFDGDRFAGGNPPAMLVNNADWLLPLAYIPFLRDIGRHFSVNEMLSLDTYKSRLEGGSGLNFVEFSYRLMQAYDFLHLFREEGCTLQMGGSDQWANITGGIELIRRADRGQAYGLVSPLMTTATGEKMGKTGSGVRAWLDPARFSPSDYYQYWIGTDDRLVERWLRLFTFLPEEEIAELSAEPGTALREARRVLAWEATALVHGVNAADQAEQVATTVFGQPDGGSSDGVASLPTTAILASEAAHLSLADAIVRAGLARGRGEARRLASQGGLRIDDAVNVDVDVPLAHALAGRQSVLLRVGKKRFRRLAVVPS